MPTIEVKSNYYELHIQDAFPPMSRDENQKWNLIPIILNDLKNGPKSRAFIQDISDVLLSSSNPKIVKLLLEDELIRDQSKIINLRNKPYQNNLRLILNKFE